MSKKIIIVIVLILVIVGVIALTSQKTEEENTALPQNSESPAESTEESTESTEKSQVKEFTLTGTNYQFSLNEIKVNQGDTVRITFVNGGGLHDWTIDEFNAATSRLQEGQQETIEFVADQAGQFEYYCSVGNHRALGMKGTLVVE